MKQVLIVIDLQKGLKDLFQMDQVVHNVNQLIKTYQRHNLPIIFFQHVDDDLPSGSESGELIDDLICPREALYLKKTRADAFWHTPLESYLRDHQIERLQICGAQTDFCIDTTIKVAVHLDFQVQVSLNTFTTASNRGLTAKQINYHYYEIWKTSFF
ncbi:isochorismatase family protein [Fructilactobacillus carniphilus]|uniref:Isochorismatase family protein n=1 Tax=Fructilactobacillus carniphilus TaxID=2940297 RepID=A0ABY5BWT3_9LACO|nr:isochorismatase family protein [Fructilactobacillus carniphilus]USS90428.1 isochorismatase family protein [Fructilactobacillus carniphilus]